MAYLLDTNVISELRRPRPSPPLLAWFGGTPADRLYLSSIVVGELRRGVVKLTRRGDLPQAEQLDRWLTRLRAEFADRIVPVSLEVAEAWGRLTATHQLPFVDGLLAATASVHRWTLVTRNVADVAPAGVPVLNPFAR